MEHPTRRGRRLPRAFYERPTIEVARDLLGTVIVRRSTRGSLAARIVEVEAYPGRGDPASHSFRGMTRRNAVMFGKGGLLYVYFTYGMHFCANVVTGPSGEGSAVLIRAVEPIEGIMQMLRNRRLVGPPKHPRLLTGGPARVCQALELGAGDNGKDLTGPEIQLRSGPALNGSNIARSARIGISSATDRRWRFYLKGNPYVSRAASTINTAQSS